MTLHTACFLQFPGFWIRLLRKYQRRSTRYRRPCISSMTDIRTSHFRRSISFLSSSSTSFNNTKHLTISILPPHFFRFRHQQQLLLSSIKTSPPLFQQSTYEFCIFILRHQSKIKHPATKYHHKTKSQCVSALLNVTPSAIVSTMFMALINAEPLEFLGM